MNRHHISVCIATYNGEKFIGKQLESILKQLSENDEIVIVDDCSADNTVGVIKKLNDPKIQLNENEVNQGVVKAFEKTINLSKNEIIFFSDQDDEWVDDKVGLVLKIMAEEQLDMVIHDGIVVDNCGEVIIDSIFKLRNSRKGIIKNFIKDTHMGSCMAIKRDVAKNVLPIPGNIGPAHDLWIGLVGEILGYKVKFIPDKLLIWKRHRSNTSSFQRRKLYIIVLNRILIFYEVVKFLIKRRFRPINRVSV